MALFDLTDAIDPVLEYRLRSAKHPDGRDYRVESPDPRTGLFLTSVHELGLAASAGATLSPSDLARLRMDDDEEKSFYQLILGDAYQQMVDDGVKWPKIQDVATHAYLTFNRNNEAAERLLAGMLGKAEPATTPETSPKTATGTGSPAPARTGSTQRRRAGSKSNPVSTPTRARTRKTATGTRGTSGSSSTPAPKATGARMVAG